MMIEKTRDLLQWLEKGEILQIFAAVVIFLLIVNITFILSAFIADIVSYNLSQGGHIMIFFAAEIMQVFIILNCLLKGVTKDAVETTP